MQAWQKGFPGAWMFKSCKVGEECVSPGLYAIAGAASALAGVTRLTGIILLLASCFFLVLRLGGFVLCLGVVCLSLD
jgi:hypothetical protein